MPTSIRQSLVQKFSAPYGQNENFLRDFIRDTTLSTTDKINIINSQRAQVKNGAKNIAQMHADIEMLRVTDIKLFNQAKEIYAHVCQLVAEILPKNINAINVSSEDLECSMTLARFEKPVVAMDGEVYEEKHINEWFDRSERFPNNDKPLTDKTVIKFKLMKDVLKRPGHELMENDLICPLTHAFMQDPVLATNGLLYERSAIESEFRKNPDYLPNKVLVSVNWVNARRGELLKKIASKQVSLQAEKTTYAFLMQNLGSEEKLCPPPAAAVPLPAIEAVKAFNYKCTPTVKLSDYFADFLVEPPKPNPNNVIGKPPAPRKR